VNIWRCGKHKKRETTKLLKNQRMTYNAALNNKRNVGQSVSVIFCQKKSTLRMTPFLYKN